jgi:putative oxidoreductase
MKVGTLLLRSTIGGLFAVHGAQKLFGVAGGHGLKGTGQYFESIGLKPGVVHAAAAGVAEAGGGLGLALGYQTPLAGAGIVATMATAIHRVHGKNGWNIQDGGFEYNAVLIAAALAVVEEGPGFLSLDALRGKQHKGLVWMLFSLGAGLAGAAGATAVSSALGGGSPQDSSQSTPAPSGATGAEPDAQGSSTGGISAPASGRPDGGSAANGSGSLGSGASTGAADPRGLSGHSAGTSFVEGVAEEQPADAPTAEPES